MTAPIYIFDPSGLRHVVRQRTRKRIQARTPNYTRALEVSYRAELRRLLKAVRASVILEVLPLVPLALAEVKQGHRTDSWADTINAQLDRIRARVRASTIGQRISKSVADAQKRELNTSLSKVGAQSFAPEPWLPGLLGSFERGTRLRAAKVADAFLGKVDAILNSGIRRGGDAKDIQAEVKDVELPDPSSMAIDEVTTLRGELTERRQQELGIDRFLWQTQEDNRVRHTHEERNGLVFEWGRDMKEQLEEKGLRVDDYEGFPGIPFGCRCSADPVLEDLAGD